MALGILGLLVVNAIPTTVGVGQAISAQKRQNAAQKETAQFQLTSTFRVDGSPASDDDEAYCVLVDGKVSKACICISCLALIICGTTDHMQLGPFLHLEDVICQTPY